VKRDVIIAGSVISKYDALTLVEEGQPLVGGTLIADIVITCTLLCPETGLVLWTLLLAADLVTLTLPNAKVTAIGWDRGITFALLNGYTASTAT